MKKIELLSPVGDFECLKAAIQNGADCVYLGASSFNARARATNFDLEELKNAIQYAKLRNVAVNLTLNTLIKNEEFDDAVSLAVNAYNFGADAIIVQDLGLAKYLLENFPEIPLHASTQMTAHNLTSVKQLENLGFSRVVLARELSIKEIEYIRKHTSVQLEVFVHGALCISYSGQCLFSSMIGGRSGNRGLCAQPCRLPYELCSSNNEILDKGYLLSPKDTCAIEFLPELIKMGIDSFKIEGRMKTPTYVATVTRIYRKYIDFILENLEQDNDTLRKMIYEKLSQKNNLTGLSDKEELAQVFNRGGFGTGHFSPTSNKNLIYKETPSNMGIYLGNIYHFNPNKGHISLKLEATASIGDKILIRDNIYTISELMINNHNYETIEKGSIVKIGRMKGKLSVGDKIFRIESSKLVKSVSPTFLENKEFKKIALNGKIIIKKGSPITLTVWSDEGFYKNFHYCATSEIIPEESIHKPVSKEDVMKQIYKTGNTEFAFSHLEIDLEENVFIPKISSLNELRRNALSGLENLILEHYTHHLTYSNNSGINTNPLKNIAQTPEISVLLNTLDETKDYLQLHHIQRLYLPLRFFTNPSYKDILEKLTKQFATYIYMPHILEDTNFETSEQNVKIILDKILTTFELKGFVVSHISQISLLKNYHLEFIGNFNLNIYNHHSIKTLQDFKFDRITLSPELDTSEISTILNDTDSCTEVLVYGKLPLMTNHYCYLGKRNKCDSSCDKRCLLNQCYYLKDRKGFLFRILPDNTSCITTIFHNKPLKVDTTSANHIRIDFLDEDFETMQNIIKSFII